MLKAVQKTIEQLDQIERDLNQIVLSAIKQHEERIKQMNTEQQLFRGVTATGARITPRYAESTIRAKVRKGQPTDRVTLLDKGDFYNSLFIDYGPDDFEIQSSDFKEVFLVRRYGENILGLTEENKNILSELIRPDIERSFNSNLL